VRLHPRRQRPENLGRIVNVDIFVEDKDVFRPIPSERRRSRPSGVAFRHFLHRYKDVEQRVAPACADCLNAGYGFPAAPEIRTFARQIHPRFVALRRKDGRVHGAAPPSDRTHFIMCRLLISLHTEIAVHFAEGSLDQTLPRQERAFDDDLGIRWDEQSFAPDFRGHEAQWFL
jgi:hypothetical protein